MEQYSFSPSYWVILQIKMPIEFDYYKNVIKNLFFYSNYLSIIYILGTYKYKYKYKFNS